MAQDSQPSNRNGWIDAVGLPHIFRSLGFAVDPGKLALGVAAIVATIVWGGLLDWVWQAANAGVPPNAVAQMTMACQDNEPYNEPEGTEGIFAVWRDHEIASVRGLLRIGAPDAVRTAPVTLEQALTATGASPTGWTRVGSVRSILYGMWWLVRHHVFFLLLFGVGALIIWSLAGGAMCRMAAVQFTRDEKLTIGQGIAEVRSRLIGGYFLAPCIPIIFAILVAVVMVIGGVVMRIPILGDLVCGLAFCLAIFGGFVVAALTLGLAVGGSLLWPAVATEGSDAFDSFSRSLSYVFSKPWKTVIYGVVAIAYAAVCWWFVRWFTYAALLATRAAVGFGTSLWWSREETDASASKLELIWPLGGPNALHAWPDWSSLQWYETVSAVLVGIWVLLAVALMWSFLVSFYFSGSTVVYLLLRRDVDGTDLDEIFEEEPNDIETAFGSGHTGSPLMSSGETGMSNDAGPGPDTPLGRESDPPPSDS